MTAARRWNRSRRKDKGRDGRASANSRYLPAPGHFRAREGISTALNLIQEVLAREGLQPELSCWGG